MFHYFASPLQKWIKDASRTSDDTLGAADCTRIARSTLLRVGKVNKNLDVLHVSLFLETCPLRFLEDR